MVSGEYHLWSPLSSIYMVLMKTNPNPMQFVPIPKPVPPTPIGKVMGLRHSDIWSRCRCFDNQTFPFPPWGLIAQQLMWTRGARPCRLKRINRSRPIVVVQRLSVARHSVPITVVAGLNPTLMTPQNEGVWMQAKNFDEMPEISVIQPAGKNRLIEPMSGVLRSFLGASDDRFAYGRHGRSSKVGLSTLQA